MTGLYMEYRWWTPSLPICTHLNDKRVGWLVVSLPVDSMNSHCRVPILIFSEQRLSHCLTSNMRSCLFILVIRYYVLNLRHRNRYHNLFTFVIVLVTCNWLNFILCVHVFRWLRRWVCVRFGTLVCSTRTTKAFWHGWNWTKRYFWFYVYCIVLYCKMYCFWNRICTMLLDIKCLVVTMLGLMLIIC